MFEKHRNLKDTLGKCAERNGKNAGWREQLAVEASNLRGKSLQWLITRTSENWNDIRNQWKKEESDKTPLPEIAETAGVWWPSTGAGTLNQFLEKPHPAQFHYIQGVGRKKFHSILVILLARLPNRTDRIVAELLPAKELSAYNATETGQERVKLAHLFEGEAMRFRNDSVDNLIDLAASMWEKIHEEWTQSSWITQPLFIFAQATNTWWPRTRQTDTLEHFLDVSHPREIPQINGVGRKKTHTILIILLAGIHIPGDWRAERLPEQDEDFLLSATNVTSAVMLVSLHWTVMKKRLLLSKFESRKIADLALMTIGTRSFSKSSLCLSDALQFESFEAFKNAQRAFGEKKQRKFAMIFTYLWASIDPDGPAGPAPLPATVQARKVLQACSATKLNGKLMKAMELAALKDQEVDILSKRFGLGDDAPKTLEEIGIGMNLTRERIRQKEELARSVLTHVGVSAAFLRALIEEQAAGILERIKRYCGNLVPFELTWKVVVGPERCFLISMLFESFEDYMQEAVNTGTAERTNAGWWIGLPLTTRARESEEELLRRIARFDRPLFVHLLANTVNSSYAEISDLLNANGKTLVSGIVFSGKISALQKRCLFAFQVAMASEKALWYQPDLFDRARNLNEGKTAGSRLFHKDVSEIPGLFVDMPGPYVAANPILIKRLKPHFENASVSDDSTHRVADEVDEAGGEYANGGSCKDNNTLQEGAGKSQELQIADILQAKGISRFENIEEEFCRRTSGAPSSVGPTMLLSSLFSRYAPGWWGLSGLKLSEADIGKLCTEKDLRNYIQAKHGGGLIEIFRFWIPELEYQWCRWAEKNASQDLFESLLSVINPEAWPLPDALRGQWVRKQAGLGIYRLHTPIGDFKSGIDDFASYYGLIMMATDRGALGYAAIAHFLGWRFTQDRRAFSTMAVMVAIGVLEQQAEHHTPHRVGPKAQAWLDQMSFDYANDPEAAVQDWPNKLHAKLMSKLPETVHGWFRVKDLQTAMPHWKAFDGLG